MRTSPTGWPAKGTITNDNAPDGYVGEYDTAVLAAISATSLTSGAVKTITSVSLEAGDYDVWGTVGFLPATLTSITAQIGGISLTDNALPAQDDGTRTDSWKAAYVPGLNSGDRLPVSARRVNISATTTVYLTAAAVFTASTMSGYGRIQWRRRR